VIFRVTSTRDLLSHPFAVILFQLYKTTLR
jgi:hypothetical protein